MTGGGDGAERTSQPQPWLWDGQERRESGRATVSRARETPAAVHMVRPHGVALIQSSRRRLWQHRAGRRRRGALARDERVAACRSRHGSALASAGVGPRGANRTSRGIRPPPRLYCSPRRLRRPPPAAASSPRAGADPGLSPASEMETGKMGCGGGARGPRRRRGRASGWGWRRWQQGEWVMAARAPLGLGWWGALHSDPQQHVAA